MIGRRRDEQDHWRVWSVFVSSGNVAEKTIHLVFLWSGIPHFHQPCGGLGTASQRVDYQIGFIDSIRFLLGRSSATIPNPHTGHAPFRLIALQTDNIQTFHKTDTRILAESPSYS